MSEAAAGHYNQEVKSKHKYRRIAESLRQRIASGALVAGDFLPTTKQLAEQYDTTSVTIDRAIGLLVAEGMVSRTPGVGTVVELSRSESTPIGTETGLVGALLQARTESHYWDLLIEGVNDILRPSGLSTLIGYHNQDYDVAMEHARLFQERGAGLIFFAPFDRPDSESYEADNSRVIRELREMGFTVIMLDRYVKTAGGHFVSESSYDQGVEMMETLIDRGYTAPLCISTDFVSVIESREAAFVEGCRRRGIDDAERRIVRVPLKRFQERDYDAVRNALKSVSKPDVMVCLNSRIFNTVIYVLAKSVGDDRIPTDVSLAGFVDFELMDLDNVEAYVEQPVREVGRAAGRMAQRILRESGGPEIQHAFVPCELRILED